GKQEEIQPILDEAQYDSSRLAVVDAREVIDNNEAPVMAVRRKKDSSVVKALRALADGEGDGFVSAGSTGAVLAGATLIVKRIPGILRPALAPVLPTAQGKGVLLIDCGANVDCKPQYLAQFGVMGSVYMEKVMHTKQPKVALINNGAEEHKGNDLTQKAHQLLKRMPIEFTGNVEARDIVSGDAIWWPTVFGQRGAEIHEGFAGTLMGMLKTEMTSTFRAKMGAALLMRL
ncbi:MAG: phosphate acyltransferase, partial [Christensenellales bacterium]